MKRNTLLRITNTVAFGITLAVNYMANALPVNGLSTGEISDRFDVFFKPAGYAFSIWGVIYLGLLVFVVFQFSPARVGEDTVSRIGPFFSLNCLANAVWLLLWHYEMFTLSVAVMAVILLSLIKIYRSLNIGGKRAAATVRWTVHLPFSLYLGWICVATIANVTIYLNWLSWDGLGIPAEIWYGIVSVLGLGLSALFALRRGDAVVSLVILWAYVAVAVHNADIGTVATVSWIAAFLAVLPVGFALFNSRRVARSAS
jgi:hypothetical protein